MGMREYWVQLQASPIVYRYIDWTLTVPLQMIEFFLILQAVKPDLGSGMFFRLLIGTVLMLVFGYLGEALIIDPWIGFIVGICGWFFILFEVFAGEGGKVKGDIKSEAVANAFNTMRFIVSVGWCIYPAGYFFGYLLGAVSSPFEPYLQPCGLREQDLVLPRNLGSSEEGDPREGWSPAG